MNKYILRYEFDDRHFTVYQNFVLNYKLMFSPYENISSNIKALGHPFAFVIQLALDIFNVIKNLVFSLVSLFKLNFADSFDASERAFRGISHIIIELYNIVFSTLSIVTRQIATCINFGYKPIVLLGQDDDGTNVLFNDDYKNSQAWRAYSDFKKYNFY